MQAVDILLRDRKGLDLEHRLSVTRGVRQVFGLELEGMAAYEDGALIPAGDWCPVKDETSLSIVDCVREANPFVALIDVGRYVWPLWELGVLSDDNIQNIAANVKVETWYESMLWPYLKDLFGDIELRYNGANYNPGRQLTTTINYRTDRALGLHLDTWEVVSIRERRKSLYRLCINVGRKDRHFIFGTRPTDLYMTDEFELYYHQGKRRYSYTDQLRDRAPHEALELCRLRIMPGEAYIAPTDLLVHDASTAEIDGMGATFAVRGAFQFSSLDWWRHV